MATMPPTHDAELSRQSRNKQSGKILVVVISLMFLFGFASIPLYRLICDVIDPGGTSSRPNGATDAYQGVQVDVSRRLEVRFVSNVNRQLPWEFRPLTPSVQVHPGEKKMAKFWAKNIDGNGSITGKAIYDINPPEAGEYFKKIECFCFQEQELAAGESIEMPLVFWFDPAMPPEIKNITVAYTFFNVDSSLEHTIKKRNQTKRAP